MNKPAFITLKQIRILIFASVALLHIILIIFVTFNVKIDSGDAEPMAGVMKLVDVEEEPPPEELPVNVQPALAETMIETDTEPPPASFSVTGPVSPVSGTGREEITYLPQHQISVLPVLPEDQIVRATVYPPIAQRSNIEGVVYLELFIDRQGNVRDVRILRETPAGRGFGDAAVNAFKGIRGKPAEANGEAVAVRYRYNINFRLN